MSDNKDGTRFQLIGGSYSHPCPYIENPADHGPWWIISGMGNLDRPGNEFGPTLVEADKVWPFINNFNWIDCPYAVAGWAFQTKTDAEASLKARKAAIAKAELDEMLWQDEQDQLHAAQAEHEDDWADEYCAEEVDLFDTLEANCNADEINQRDDEDAPVESIFQSLDNIFRKIFRKEIS